MKFLFLFLFLCFNGFATMTEEEDLPSYSINLMWVNKDSTRLEHIVPSSQLDILREASTGWRNKWANSGKNVSLNFWYDGNLVVEDQIEDTKTFLGDLWNMRDVRKIPFVENNSDIFKTDIPVYFRADLLRWVVGKHLLEEEKVDFFIYSDLNVQPEDHAYLFSETTQYFLDEYGFVMCKNDLGPKRDLNGGDQGFENKFMILTQNENLLPSIDDALINPACSAYRELKKELRFTSAGKSEYKPLTEIIYPGTIALFTNILIKKGILTSIDTIPPGCRGGINFSQPDTYNHYSLYNKWVASRILYNCADGGKLNPGSFSNTARLYSGKKFFDPEGKHPLTFLEVFEKGTSFKSYWKPSRKQKEVLKEITLKEGDRPTTLVPFVHVTAPASTSYAKF